MKFHNSGIVCKGLKNKGLENIMPHTYARRAHFSHHFAWNRPPTQAQCPHNPTAFHLQFESNRNSIWIKLKLYLNQMHYCIWIKLSLHLNQIEHTSQLSSTWGALWLSRDCTLLATYKHCQIENLQTRRKMPFRRLGVSPYGLFGFPALKSWLDAPVCNSTCPHLSAF